jgi:nitrite reductase/ring-hydroxylating ferredoxin subunit
LVLQIMSWRARGKGHWLRGATLSAMGVATTVVGGYLGGHLVFVQRVGVDREVPAPGVATWRVVCRADDVPDLRPIGVTVDDAKLVIVRRGPIVDAMAAVCSHAGGPLDEGTVTDSGLRCPWHGSVFALEDGRVLRGPATAPQPIYEARINDGMVEIRGPIDESALAGDDVIRLTDGSALHQV